MKHVDGSLSFISLCVFGLNLSTTPSHLDMYNDNNIMLGLRKRVYDGDFIYTVWFIVGVNKLILLFNFHAWQAKSFSCSDQIVWLLPPIFLTNLKTSGSSLFFLSHLLDFKTF